VIEVYITVKTELLRGLFGKCSLGRKGKKECTCPQTHPLLIPIDRESFLLGRDIPLYPPPPDKTLLTHTTTQQKQHPVME